MPALFTPGRDRETAHELEQLSHWLVDRDTICRRQVVEWMLRATTLSAGELAILAADRDWARVLTGVLVESTDGGEHVRGFLQGVSPGRGIGVLQLDGLTRWVSGTRWRVVHPALTDRLASWALLAAEAGVRQHVEQ
jgi:hypothetical protein